MRQKKWYANVHAGIQASARNSLHIIPCRVVFYACICNLLPSLMCEFIAVHHAAHKSHRALHHSEYSMRYCYVSTSFRTHFSSNNTSSKENLCARITSDTQNYYFSTVNAFRSERSSDVAFLCA